MIIGQVVYLTATGAETTNREDAKTQYMHVLKPFIPYSENIKNAMQGVDIVINYTLDNYIKIYGNVGGAYIKKDGYLLNKNDINIQSGKINGLKYKNKEIQSEKLDENIAYTNLDDITGSSLSEYVYDKDKRKIYYDVFIDKAYLVDRENKRQTLSDDVTELVGIYYKKAAVPVQIGTKWEVEYYYQALNR